MQFIDFHCDTITTAFESGLSMDENNLHIDFKRLANYNAPVQYFAVWLRDERLGKPFLNTVKYIDFFKEELKKTKHAVKFGEGYTDIIYNRINKTSTGLLAVEGGEAIENDLDNIHRLREMGVTMMTLTWNRKNNLGFGAVTGSDFGLTDFGKDALKELNKAGILADVSHINDKGFYDVCRLTEKPIIASHSNSRAVCNVPRNLTDDQIKEIASLGGIIGFNLCGDFIKEGGKPKGEDVIRQIEHILEVGGESILGLGCDYDGIQNPPEKLENVGCSVYFFHYLADYFGEDVVQKIFYANADSFLQKNL
ncbi:MAG: dipeptidase [Clostridiales bacterium]|nr:dipeptidase [Clostridiales bacterium]